jgi:hypothetical protein
MDEIPDFADAFERFRRFLGENGHPGDVFWVFREDLWQLSPTQSLLRYPPPSENAVLVQKVFAEGRARGLLQIKAVATAGEKVAATVWFPKGPSQTVQGWDHGMKLSMVQPLPNARMLAPWRWGLLRLLPRFQRYQILDVSIGTRSWAAE